MAITVPLRHELKFYINPVEYQVLSRQLDRVLERDPNGDENNEYHIRSLYFDTIYNDALLDKLDGVKNRDKYRIRIYNFSDKFIRMECKTKVGSLISKRSVAIPKLLAEQIIAGDPTGLEQSRSGLLRDVYREMKINYLHPVVIVDYVREAYLHPAEIEVVPADKCRDFGLDRSMLLGYGHDDRVCSFASLEAILRLPAVPKHTCCCLLADKEEIGSVGATGMRAHYFENAMAELLALTSEQYSDLMLRRALAACRMLSCDVSAGYDPLYASCFEKKNAAYLGRGVCYNKYTGSRGKSGSNDANAEFLGHLRKIMDDNHVAWQTAELGKVDVGGGGTIAYICALYGMEVVDSGVPVLSMHAPLEIISKADLYEAVKAYHAFMQEA